MAYITLSDIGQSNQDLQRRGTWGRTGCFIGFSPGGVPNFVTSTAGSKFAPLPAAKIFEAKNTIAHLQGSIERKGNNVDMFGQEAIAKYAEYLRTTVPVCAAPGVASSAVGTVASLWGSNQTTFGANAYRACLENRQRLQQSIMDGNIAFTNMGNARSDLYADYQELMQFAPSQDAWTSLCSKKLVAEDRFNALTQKVSAFALDALRKLQKEEEVQAAENSKLNEMTALLQAFIQAIKDMIAAIASIFGAFIEGASAVVKLMAKYPKAALYGGLGLVAGVGVLAVGGYAWWQYKSIKTAAGLIARI